MIPTGCLNLQATHRRDARTDPDEGWTAGPCRLRVRAQRHRQSVHAVRAARRLAPVEVTDRHTAIDYAHVLKDLADIHFPYKKSIIWSKTISMSTARLHSTKLSRLPKL